ncbi:Oidioi.mRNA.OKI2018_I69.chr2.g4453.t1.cds [Oikopleura dioica]|uniref:Oidioi.mRNA.OKI2018_I69.chr2.g4453.t1.cds n=1 Tax=Oikopleura dioica TaxID=34765 RepID=A0ABN7SXD5_OIKDI|nr:Oidioi.mRNA.OKI2018_I69.chr2.g4453.t1.cds [Oikopleura dioica]
MGKRKSNQKKNSSTARLFVEMVGGVSQVPFVVPDEHRTVSALSFSPDQPISSAPVPIQNSNEKDEKDNFFPENDDSLQIFQEFDRNRDGKISIDELMTTLDELGLACHRDDAKQMIKVANNSAEGKNEDEITFDLVKKF